MSRLSLMLAVLVSLFANQSFADGLTRHADGLLKGGSKFYDDFAKATVRGIGDDAAKGLGLTRGQSVGTVLPQPLPISKLPLNVPAKQSGTVSGVAGATVHADDLARNVPTKIPQKVEDVVVDRGWTKDEITSLTSGQAVHISRSTNYIGDPATAYFRKDHHHVVKNNHTGVVFHISDRNKKVVFEKNSDDKNLFAIDKRIVNPPNIK